MAAGLISLFVEAFRQTDHYRIAARMNGQGDDVGFIVIADQLLGKLDSSKFFLYQLSVRCNTFSKKH